MKKRIGNDIHFTWHIYRKSGEEQVPESFTGKDVAIKLISPLQRPVTIEDVSIATGVVTFTFRGKHQVTLGNYVAVLLENKGENGMVTIDVVNAVTLVAHSYMEEDGDEGDVIEATSVELTSEITAGGGGSIEQQQADWAQTDASAVDYIKNKPDLGLYVPKKDDDGHGNQSIYSPAGITMFAADEHGIINSTGTFGAGGWYVTSPQGTFQTSANSIYRGTLGIDEDSVVWEKTATQQIPAATTEANGLMSASDKKKLDDMKGSSTADDVSYDNSKSGLSATNVQNAIDEMADTNLYETVVLTVGSADSSFNPVGQTITVTLEDGSATQYTVPMSRQITFIVQRGMRYTISGTSTDDYRVLPISVKAAIPIRYLTMRYIPIATGVFILQKDGNYYLREEYDAETMAKDAVGVLVLTSALINAGQGIVIGKNDKETSSYNYWDYGRSKTLGNARFPSKTTIIGRSNTVSMVGFGGYLAAEYLNSLTLSTDEMDMPGYLMCYLEATILAANNTEIAECLRTIGGVAKNFAKNNTYYTSTDIRTDPTISACANNDGKRAYAGMNNSNLKTPWKAKVIPVYKFQLS